MTDFMDVLKMRRSVRKFEEREIPDALLKTVMEAIQWSPSWANTQCWEVIIIRDDERKKRLQETIFPKNPATKAVAKAPVLIAVCGKLKVSGYYQSFATTKFEDWFMFDLGIAVQSLCLCAHSLGLGTVIVGLFDHDKAGEILEIPEGYELVSLIPMGFPETSPSAPKRKEINEFVHYEKF